MKTFRPLHRNADLEALALKSFAIRPPKKHAIFGLFKLYLQFHDAGAGAKSVMPQLRPP